MVKEILQYKNIGTPNYLIQLLQYANKESNSKKELQDLFFNKSIDGRYIFDGGINFLAHINFFIIHKNNKVVINKSLIHFVQNKELLIKKIINMFLIELSKDSLFKELFNKSSMFYEDSGNLVISNNAFKFKYTNIKQFLLDFNIIFEHPYINNNYALKSEYKGFFDNVKIQKKINKKILSLEELKKLQAIKDSYGEDAEKFVVDYEKLKFKSHPLANAIEKISDFNVSAGYDVVSLIDEESSQIDKFIEVKSYSGEKPYFYWSKNEVKVAKEEKNKYFLYLINREKIDNINYAPIIIQNPYVEIFNSSQWGKKCEKWYFNKIID